MSGPSSGRALYAAFPYGVNIPGGVWLTTEQVQTALQPLAPTVTFARIVRRPDSILVWSKDPATEDSVRRAVSEALDCTSVVLSAAVLERVAEAAFAAIRVAAPYRVMASGVECELCLVLASERLPAHSSGAGWLFSQTRRAVVALNVLERRALLARKPLRTPSGGRAMLGRALIDPWAAVLEENGVTVACLTSRTLNQVAQVVAAAKALGRAAPG